MLALSPQIGYIHEPFGLHHRPGLCTAHFNWWFPYITAENEGQYLRPVSDTLAFRYRTAAELKAVHSCRDAARLVRDYLRFASYACTGVRRPLLKDPMALFSAEWLNARFGVQPIIVIRHPAAFASSLKRLGWTHPFGHFLAQPLLMRDFLTPYRSKIEEFAISERPILDQAILLWELIHYTILQYRSRHPEWLFVRHEDLSRQPVQRFQKIFQGLGLPFESVIKRQIAEYSAEGNPIESMDPMNVRRCSTKIIGRWRQTLSADEIQHIRRAVEPVSQEFYDDGDWNVKSDKAPAQSRNPKLRMEPGKRLPPGPIESFGFRI
jgi:hypothetical protein